MTGILLFQNINAAFTRLQNELKDAHQELKLKDEEVVKLTRIRQDVESELEELTASLFQASDSFNLLFVKPKSFNQG